MAVQYLLPCECGNTTPIDTSQAGSSVPCSCGKQIDVPSLRAIRELTPASDDVAPSNYQWNPAAGLVFVCGLVLALVGAGMAFFMHLNVQTMVNLDSPPEADVAAWIEEIDSMPPELLFDEWNAQLHVGLGEYQMSPFVQARMMARQFEMYRNTALVVMACGLIFAATSIFLRRKE